MLPRIELWVLYPFAIAGVGMYPDWHLQNMRVERTYKVTQGGGIFVGSQTVLKCYEGPAVLGWCTLIATGCAGVAVTVSRVFHRQAHAGLVLVSLFRRSCMAN